MTNCTSEEHKERNSGGKFEIIRMDMQQVTDMLFSAEVMTSLVVITLLMMLFSHNFVPDLYRGFH